MNIFYNMRRWLTKLLSPVPHIEQVLEEEDPPIASSLPKKRSTFDPNSDRAKQGLAFQAMAFEKLQARFPTNDTFEECWDYFKAKDPTLEIYDLACLEKEWGDITFVYEGQRFWIECCFAMGKKSSWFCEMKRIKFNGINKFYCWGKIDEPGKMWFIPSNQWNAYVKKCDKVRQGKKSFRVIPKHLIGDNIRAAKRGVNEFAKHIS